MQMIKEFFQALRKPYTYKLFSNVYAMFGFLWGLPLVLIMLGMYFHFSGESFSFGAIIEHYSKYDLHTFFLLHPFAFAIVLGAVGTIRFEKNKKIAELISKLENESQNDALTKLYNRRHFQKMLSTELSRANRDKEDLSLVLFDLDKFKLVNDLHGHQAGDIVLENFGTLLKKTCRPYDVPARWGGEEFVILLPETNSSLAIDFSNRIRILFSELKHEVPSGIISCTLSAGIAQYNHGEETQTFIERCDKGLYQAKESGRNQVAFIESGAASESTA